MPWSHISHCKLIQSNYVKSGSLQTSRLTQPRTAGSIRIYSTISVLHAATLQAGCINLLHINVPLSGLPSAYAIWQQDYKLSISKNAGCVAYWTILERSHTVCPMTGTVLLQVIWRHVAPSPFKNRCWNPVYSTGPQTTRANSSESRNLNTKHVGFRLTVIHSVTHNNDTQHTMKQSGSTCLT